jgi:hypothetical protein
MLKLDILQKALKYYAQSAECHDNGDLDDVFDAIEHVAAVYDNALGDDYLNTSFEIIPTITLTDLLNIATYDDLGKLLKVHSIDDPNLFGRYIHNVKPYCDGCTNEQLESGFEFICDLWSDNERAGSNNPDGTFKRTT